MMKIKFTGLIILFAYVTCFSQIDTTAVPFVAYWSKGDSYNFKITKIKQKFTKGNLTQNDSSSYIANFLVIDSTATNYKIKWSYKTNLSNFNIPPKSADKFSKYQITEVIYTTSELGEFLGIENWEEVAGMTKELFSDLIETLADGDDSKKKDLTKTMQPVLKIYESKQGVEQLVFKEIQYFHFPFGLEYNVTEPIIYEDQLPNMFGGKPIRGNAKIYFDSVDFENSFCVLIQEMELNPEDTKDIILTLFKRMKLNNKEMKKAMKEAQFDIRDYNKYEYYYYPGVPLKIETKRESLMDMNEEKAKRIEITRIELLN